MHPVGAALLFEGGLVDVDQPGLLETGFEQPVHQLLGAGHEPDVAHLSIAFSRHQNLAGAAFILVSLYYRPNAGAIMIEVLWVLIAVWALISWAFKRDQDPASD